MQNKPHANNWKHCGAKTRSGKPCKGKAMANGRCRMHGGKSTGAPPEKMKKNANAKKHGLFSKYLPKETIDIMNDVENMEPIDILWMNIKMQFASIIRAQQIMFVENEDDLSKEVRKEVDSPDFATKEYEIQFAWDKQATFMNSLSRSMAELRNMLKQFVEMADYDDYRLLEIKRMQMTIDKTEKEKELIEERTKLLKGEKKDTSLLDVLIDTVTSDE